MKSYIKKLLVFAILSICSVLFLKFMEYAAKEAFAIDTKVLSKLAFLSIVGFSGALLAVFKHYKPIYFYSMEVFLGFGLVWIDLPSSGSFGGDFAIKFGLSLFAIVNGLDNLLHCFRETKNKEQFFTKAEKSSILLALILVGIGFFIYGSVKNSEAFPGRFELSPKDRHYGPFIPS